MRSVRALAVTDVACWKSNERRAERRADTNGGWGEVAWDDAGVVIFAEFYGGFSDLGWWGWRGYVLDWVVGRGQDGVVDSCWVSKDYYSF